MPNPYARLRAGGIFGGEQNALSPADFSNLFRAPPNISSQIRPSGLEPEIRFGGRDRYGPAVQEGRIQTTRPRQIGGVSQPRGGRTTVSSRQPPRVSLRNGQEQLKLQKRVQSLRERAQRAKEIGDDRDFEIKKQLADVTEYKAQNPEMEIKAPKGGNIVAINPVTGEVTDLGIPSGEMSQRDRLMLERKIGLERVSETGKESRRTEGVRQVGREKSETQRQTNRIATIRERGGSIAGTETPREERMRIANRAQEVILLNPQWADKIQIDGDFVTVKPPTEGFFGLGEFEEDEYGEIVNSILGDDGDQSDTIRVRAPNGQTGSWPTGDDLPQGYTRIP